MKLFNKLSFVLILILIPLFLFSQVPPKYHDNLKNYAELSLDIDLIKEELKKAPLIGELSRNSASNSKILLVLPNQKAEQFAVLEAPILSEKLSNNYPDIKSYIIQGIDSPEANGRINISPYGISGYLSLDEGMMILAPLMEYSKSSDYISYYEHDILNLSGTCDLSDEDLDFSNFTNTEAVGNKTNSCFQNGAILRTYDLVVTCTGEYYGLYNNGGGDVDVISAITNKIAAINVIYERELAIRLNVVEPLLHNDQQLIHLLAH